METPIWEEKSISRQHFIGILVHIHGEPNLIIKGILPKINVYFKEYMTRNLMDAQQTNHELNRRQAEVNRMNAHVLGRRE